MTAPIRLDERYELFRIVTDYEALQEAFLERIEDLDISRMTVDEIGGFTPGYSSKLLCRPPMKKLGTDSLPKLLKATGMALMLVVDDERFAPLKAQLGKPRRKMRTHVRIKRVKGFFTKENAGKIRKKAWADVPLDVRRKMARKAANARWKAVRRRLAMAALESGAPSAKQPIAADASPVNAG